MRVLSQHGPHGSKSPQYHLWAFLFYPVSRNLRASAVNRQRNLLRGFVMYICLAGRRFLNRGSRRPGRLPTR